jgi:serine phosphatase RsbU (regulator of sigma subunit)
MRPNPSIPIGRAKIDPDDLLILYTDGLPEAVGGQSGSAFGFERLKDLLRSAGSPGRIHDRLIVAFDEHVGDGPLTDDYTLVVMARAEPAGAPADPS